MPAPWKRLTEQHGLDEQSLKVKFDVKTLRAAKAGDKVKALVDSNRDILKGGIERNRKDYRLYKAMDWAFDAPFYQISYTQLRGLLSNKPDDKKVLETVNSWGLTHLLADEVDAAGKPCCDSMGNRKKVIDLPVFTNIFIPLVMAYTTIRWAKLFNEIDQVPLYKYEPVQNTKENRARCEIITQLVQRQSAQFDYKADERQSLLQTLLYGLCINFPREAWYVDKQEDEAGKEVIRREGLRFNMPHPSRMYYDLYQRLSSLNSNSGCEYAGYWELCRYKNIVDNKHYWNKDQVSFGASSWFDIGKSDFLEQVFPCNMTFPNSRNVGMGGTGDLDRQNDAAAFYTSSDYNNATLLTQHFRHLVPAEWGLGTYKYPVMMRFVIANEETVLWAEPLAYDRLPVYAYDADFNRSRFDSLALQIIPFQDQIGNLFSQWIMAVRENLRNPIFVDGDKVPAEALKALQNQGNKNFDGRMYVPFSSTENLRFKQEQREAFFTPQLTHHNTSELASVISGLLDMMERILQFSSQELGQPATHEQTAEESRIIFRHTTNRVQLTGSFRDDGMYAKKVMLYDAAMAYADETVTVGISSSLTSTNEELSKLMDTLGFTISDKSEYDDDNPDATIKVTGKKSALAIEAFASTRDATNRIDNPAIADAMSKIFLAVAGNPVLIQSIGPIQLVELLNQIINAAGLPKEFRIKGKNIDVSANPEQQGEQLKTLLTEFSKQVKEAIDQSRQQILQEAGQGTAQAIQQVAGQLGQAMSQAGQQVNALAEATAQNNQVNQVQSQQIEQLNAALAALNQKIEAVMEAAAAPPPPPPAVQVPAY